MLELGSELGKERAKLQRRARQARKYTIPSLLAVFVGVVLSFILPFLMAESTEAWFFQIRFLWYFVPLILGLLVSTLVGKFALPYALSKEERLFLKVCSALDDLGMFIEDGRESDRKRAEKKVKNILEEIEEWNIGSIKLCREVIGSHFKSFKEAFYRKLIGAVRQREKDDLMTAYRILKEFAKYLLKSKPDTKDLDSITSKMNEGINVTIPLETAGTRKAFLSLRELRYVRHIFAVTVSLASGYLTGYIGYFVVKVPIEYAYTMAVTVALGGIAAYLNYLRK